MREFFRGRKRKACSAALVMACVFIAAWVRSLFAHDSIGFPLTSFTAVGMLSASNVVILCVQFRPRIDNKWTVVEWSPRFDLLDVDGITWFAYGVGFGIGRVTPCQRSSGVESFIFTVPYWSLVSSCLLMSVYLSQLVKPLWQPKADCADFLQPTFFALAALVTLVTLIVCAAPSVQ